MRHSGDRLADPVSRQLTAALALVMLLVLVLLLLRRRLVPRSCTAMMNLVGRPPHRWTGPHVTGQGTMCGDSGCPSEDGGPPSQYRIRGQWSPPAAGSPPVEATICFGYGVAGLDSCDYHLRVRAVTCPGGTASGAFTLYELPPLPDTFCVRRYFTCPISVWC